MVMRTIGKREAGKKTDTETRKGGEKAEDGEQRTENGE
jgi:hypothetical protein